MTDIQTRSRLGTVPALGPVVPMVHTPGVSDTPDLDTCTEDYAQRFDGPVGEWFLRVQEEAVLGMLARYPGASVLDVGGGHGQLAGPLARAGYAVTVLGSGLVCSKRVVDLVESGACQFLASGLRRLPFVDRSFDIVISFRVVAHLTSWETLLGEMARVARQAVILDFPSSRSLNALTPRMFSVKQRIEGNTRLYSVIDENDLITEVRRSGYQLSAQYAQFLLPMVAHRALGIRTISVLVERILRELGLTTRFGSPVIVAFSRGGQ